MTVYPASVCSAACFCACCASVCSCASQGLSSVSFVSFCVSVEHAFVFMLGVCVCVVSVDGPFLQILEQPKQVGLPGPFSCVRLRPEYFLWNCHMMRYSNVDRLCGCLCVCVFILQTLCLPAGLPVQIWL